MLKSKTNGLEMWWLHNFPQNLVLIRVRVSEKRGSTDDGRLRHDSSFAVQ